jgi:hypothetical protein
MHLTNCYIYFLKLYTIYTYVSCPLDLPSEGRMRLPLSAGGGTQPPPHREICGNRRGGGVRVNRQKMRYLVMCFILF